MNKAYIVYQDGTYFSTDVLGNITCTKNPLQALALRNKRSERAVIAAEIHSIVFEINTEKKLNQTLEELDNSIKLINEMKANLESQHVK